MIGEIMMKLFEENERLRNAGCQRNNPETWRPDLVRSINQYIEEIKHEQVERVTDRERKQW